MKHYALSVNNIIYVYRDGFEQLKGKIDNVTIVFSNDRNHVAIFPLSILSTLRKYEPNVHVDHLRVHVSRLITLINGEMETVCEKCEHYVYCVSENFRSCNQPPTIATGLLPKMDLSSLTFIGTVTAGYQHWNALNKINLSPNAVDKMHAALCDRAKYATECKAYRQTNCSKCILNCKKLRQPDRIYSEDLLRQIYDIYDKTIFGGKLGTLFQWLSATRKPGSDAERTMANLLEGSTDSYSRIFISPFVNDTFLVQLNYSSILVPLGKMGVFPITIPNPKPYIAELCSMSSLFRYNNYHYNMYYLTVPSPIPSLSELLHAKRVDRTEFPGTDLRIPRTIETDQTILDRARAEAKHIWDDRSTTKMVARSTVPPYRVYMTNGSSATNNDELLTKLGIM